MRPQTDGTEPGRVLVIGLDGAGFDVIGPLLADGRMPNLARLIGNGVSGNLRSTCPPTSAIAWPSFYTGTGPGKHGVYGFSRFHPDTYRSSLTNAESVRVHRIWDLLSARDLDSIVVNVPMTYPPSPLRGVLVSGLLAPSARSEFTYPSGVRDELATAVAPFRSDPSRTGLRRRTVGQALRWLGSVTELRTAMCLHLMRNRPWDLCVAVFRTSDVIQHAFLDSAVRVDQEPYQLEGRGGAIIGGHYEQLDAAIGELLEAAPDDTSVFVMSDHGANVKRRCLCVNEWLASIGLLKWARKMKLEESGGGFRHRSLGRQLQALRIGFIGRLLPQKWLDREILVPRAAALLGWGQAVDWAGTRAFCDPTMPEGIRVNLRGRERDGLVGPGEEYEQVVNDVVAAARELADDGTGERVVEDALRREEAYEGPLVDDAPDVVLSTEYSATRREASRGQVLRRAKGLQRAGHSSNGIVVGAGPAFANRDDSVDASITDLAPTILYLLGAPIPTYVDGEVLTELLDPGLVGERSPEYVEGEPSTRSPGDGAADDPDERVLRRLRDLGYL